MAVKKLLIGGSFYITYQTDEVFGRERNYLILEEYGEQVYINSIHFLKSSGETKTINLSGYDLLKNKKFLLDATAYYQWGFDEIGYNYTDMDGSVFADRIKIGGYTFLDCYSPFLEVVPDSCRDAPYARILPPNRMLWDGKKETSSLLSAMRYGDYFSGYKYEMEGVPYETYRPSDAWLTTAQKNEHLGETYHNTLKSNGNLADLDSNGLPLWIEQGELLQTVGASFGEQRRDKNIYCRTKTLFVNYNGLTIGAMPDGYRYYVFYYDKNKTYKGRDTARAGSVTLNNADTYPYIALMFDKLNQTATTPSDFVGITSRTLTNPEAGKSWRWYKIGGAFKWQEITQEQLVNNKFYWAVNKKSYSDDVINKGFTFGSKFSAKLIRIKNIFSPTSWTPLSTMYSIDRSVELVDSAVHYLYARWLTPWGISVEHLFYLDTYATDKEDAQEVESEYLYEEHSKHVIKGSFYLDNIREPYDLWYYQTLANSELVELYLPIFSVRKDIYMPNASDYVAVKITGSNIKDAVVDGVAQSTITFDFEMR